MSRVRIAGFSVGILLLSLVLIFFLVPEVAKQAEAGVLDGTVEGRVRSFPPPEILSRAAVLYDFSSGKLLYEKSGDLPIAPASMTKLMTLHLAYEAIERGDLAKDSEVWISDKGDFRNQPRGSSLMFIEEGQRTTVLELMRGLAVPSGNDAAQALARRVSGSVEKFVEEMNLEAKRLGLEEVYFVDPAGIGAENRVTARSFGRFCLMYIRKHPYALEELHSLREFTYPREENIPPGDRSAYGSISQENYNLLVGRHPWVDGLKTGYIDESGYNISVTAEKSGRRLIAVILGGPGETTREGNLSRVIDGTQIVSYGFYAFREVEPASVEVEDLRVFGGRTARLKIEVPVPEPILLSTDEAGRVSSRIQVESPLRAPIEEGDRVGTLRVYTESEEISRYPVRAAETVEEGGVFRRIWDGLLLLGET